MSNEVGSVELNITNIVLGNQKVLTDVSFKATPGSVHCLIGPNGAGKSTLLRVLSADIAGGKLLLSGLNATSASVGELARVRGVLRPNAKPNFPFQIQDVLRWSIDSSDEKFAGQQVERALVAVGLAEMQEQKVTELSSGQLTKVNIAATILQETDIIFADEPEANLDPVARKQIWELLRNTKKTLVITTHDLEIVKEFATHVTALVNGRIVFSKDISSISAHELRDIYLN